MKSPRPFVLQVLLVLGFSIAPYSRVCAQSAQSPSQPPIPQWQIDAGGKMTFDVASVKPNKSGVPPSGPVPKSNVPLDPGPGYFPNGGLFSATNLPLSAYIAFAYKLEGIQLQYLLEGLPAWANMDRFDIQARAEGDLTKDQIRLMMQSLLADRFKLALHAEARQMPFYALVLATPGKLGPQLLPHSDDPPCADPNGPPLSPIGTTNKLPSLCGQLTVQVISGHFHPMVRGLTLPVLASYIANLGGLGRPVLDQTGLSGTFDVTIDYLPQTGQPGAQVVNADPSDPSAPPSLFTALRDQLDLKIEPRTGPVDVLVIDHVETPSPN